MSVLFQRGCYGGFEVGICTIILRSCIGKYERRGVLGMWIWISWNVHELDVTELKRIGIGSVLGRA